MVQHSSGGKTYLWGPKISLKRSCFFPKGRMPTSRTYGQAPAPYLSGNAIIHMPLAGSNIVGKVIVPDPIDHMPLAGGNIVGKVIVPNPIDHMPLAGSNIVGKVIAPDPILTS